MLEKCGGRRAQFSIIAEILEVARVETTETHAMSKARLSYAQLGHYFELAYGCRLLARQRGKNVYLTTEKGRCFLKLYYGLAQLLETKEKDSLHIQIPLEQLLKAPY